MPHFKDQEGRIFWLDDQDVKDWKREGWQELTNAEADEMRAAAMASIKVDRRGQIKARLSEIDAESIRAMRAFARGKAGKADGDKLDALEAQAAELRAELAAISQGGAQ